MTRAQQLAVVYAIGSEQDHGDTFLTAEEARKSALYIACGYPVLKLIVDEQGQVVHTEEVQ